MKHLILILLFALVSSSCQIADGDLKNDSINSLSVEASADNLMNKRSIISGTISLGFTSNETVELKIIDNGVVVLEDSILADASEIGFNYDINLVDEGNNDIVVETSYFDSSKSKKVSVTVDPSLLNLDISATSSDLSRFQTNISGTVQLGYITDEQIHLSILDNGIEIFKDSLDASGLSIDFQQELNLLFDGENTLIVEVAYSGNKITKAILVNTKMSDPQVVFSPWNQQFIDSFGLLASSTLTITKDASYTIEYVEYSYKSNEWHRAESTAENVYDLELENPDIGDVEVTVKIGQILGTHKIETIHKTSLTVDPSFNCTDNPATLMLPTTDLIRRQRYENRTMVGYFGDPKANHTVDFVITADVQGDGIYYSVGETLSVGYSSISTQFYVDKLECNNNPCSLSYDFDLYIDGAYICSRANFGRVYDY